MKKIFQALSALVLCATYACQPAQDNSDGTMPPDGSGVSTRQVALTFKAKVGSRDLTCTEMFDKVGTGTERFHAGDLRVYVHNLRLVTAGGAEAPVSLVPDQLWQSGDVALLDFTDNAGSCTGSVETNRVVKGTVVADGKPFAGLKFTIGVPFAQNHQDASLASSPLNLSALFWSWNSGYKFFLLEGTSNSAKQLFFHLGSTGCIKDANDTVTSCSAPNRPEVSLTGFDPQSNAVVLDVAEVLAGVNLDRDVACHSSAAQPDCGPTFATMGLPLGGTPALPSRVFRVE